MKQESEFFRISLRIVSGVNAVQLSERSADKNVNVRQHSPLRRREEESVRGHLTGGENCYPDDARFRPSPLTLARSTSAFGP